MKKIKKFFKGLLKDLKKLFFSAKRLVEEEADQLAEAVVTGLIWQPTGAGTISILLSTIGVGPEDLLIELSTLAGRVIKRVHLYDDLKISDLPQTGPIKIQVMKTTKAGGRQPIKIRNEGNYVVIKDLRRKFSLG